MVRLKGPAGHQDITALVHGRTDKKFQLPNLISRGECARLIIPFEVEMDSVLPAQVVESLEGGREPPEGETLWIRDERSTHTG
jgi:hypothetical protein